MKSGSLTAKQVGDAVVEGEFLGVVGSSGNSTGPHLHLETYDSLGNLIEPLAGACHSLNADTWWQSQRVYYDSGVNRVTTGDAVPAVPSCPDDESPNFRATFPVGAQSYFATYYRDQLDTQQSLYTIYRPDGAIGSYYSHSKIVCSTAGNRVANLAPAAGSRYYLVGPRNSTREGSLGRAKSGAERPVGISACFPRSIIECP